MSQVAIFPHQDTIGVLWPVSTMPILEVALRDLPAGTPFKIIDQTELPDTRAFRAAWTADFSQPDGYALGYQDWVLLNRESAE